MDALEVAKYFIAKSHSDESAGELISNLKLQKLLYYAQGFYLATRGEPLFKDEIEAWMHGPVVPPLYHIFKKYGDGPIAAEEIGEGTTFNDDTAEFLDEIYRLFGQYSAWKLRNMTHEEAPWDETFRAYERDTTRGNVIPRVKMREYFETQLEK